MLGARTESPYEQRDQQQDKAGADAGDAIAKTSKRSAGRQYDRRAKPLGEKTAGNLQTCHRADEYAAQHAEFGKTQSKLGLPQRQQHIDEIRIAIMQRMRTARNHDSVPLVAKHL